MTAQLHLSQFALPDSPHMPALPTALRSNTSRSHTDDLRKVWRQLDHDSCPRHYNFHMHTVCSDGKLPPGDLVSQVLDIGLKGFAITDHHSIKGYARARNLLPDDGPTLWTGVEITAVLLGVEVHVLGYGFEPQDDVLQTYLTGERVRGIDGEAKTAIAALHQAGGLAVLAHPFRYRRAASELVAAAVEVGIDGIEAYYSYRNSKPWSPSPVQTEEALELAAAHGLDVTCGTDTHGLNLLQRI